MCDTVDPFATARSTQQDANIPMIALAVVARPVPGKPFKRPATSRFAKDRRRAKQTRTRARFACSQIDGGDSASPR